MLDPALAASISYPRVIREKRKDKKIPFVRNAIDLPSCDVRPNL